MTYWLQTREWRLIFLFEEAARALDRQAPRLSRYRTRPLDT